MILVAATYSSSQDSSRSILQLFDGLVGSGTNFYTSNTNQFEYMQVTISLEMIVN